MSRPPFELSTLPPYPTDPFQDWRDRLDDHFNWQSFTEVMCFAGSRTFTDDFFDSYFTDSETVWADAGKVLRLNSDTVESTTYRKLISEMYEKLAGETATRGMSTFWMESEIKAAFNDPAVKFDMVWIDSVHLIRGRQVAVNMRRMFMQDLQYLPVFFTIQGTDRCPAISGSEQNKERVDVLCRGDNPQIRTPQQSN